MMLQHGGAAAQACFIVSFLWLSHSLDKSSFIDQPRLSASLLLLISAGTVVGLGSFSKWLPGADGRFDSEAVLQGLHTSLPSRPRKYYVPLIVFLVFVRVELLQTVLRNFQCSSSGIEAFLPAFLSLYYFFSHKTKEVDDDEPEDMWSDVWTDIKAWIAESPVLLFGTTVAVSGFVFWSLNLTPRSTYFCSTMVDVWLYTRMSQFAGLAVDAAVAILLQSVLAWQRTSKARMRTLGSMLGMAAVAVGLWGMMAQLFEYREPASHEASWGAASPVLFFFDLLGSGLVLGGFLASAAFWISETDPLVPASFANFAVGIIACFQAVSRAGTYSQTSVAKPLVVLAALSGGFMIFTHSLNMHSVLFIKRGYFALLLVALFIASALHGITQGFSLERHPVDDLIYNSRIGSERWLRHATVSTTLRSAVNEYKERHGGRSPPPKFDKWFQYAIDRQSPVVDKFDQIERDTLPFWGLSPQAIRDGHEALKGQPDIGIITIQDGKASHGAVSDADQRDVLNQTVAMISNFVEHLPPMTIAINLKERPRVLVPWDDLNRLKTSPVSPAPHGKRDGSAAGAALSLENPSGVSKALAANAASKSYFNARDFRDLQVLACPPGSPARAGVEWNVRDLCVGCAAPHSQGLFLDKFEKSLDPCHQPDLFNLHDFHTLPHRAGLHRDLLPLFSRSKTDSFNDVVLPLPRPAGSKGGAGTGADRNGSEPLDDKTFESKATSIFWQGEVTTAPDLTHDSLVGGQGHRLVHMQRNASAADTVPMILARPAGVGKGYRYVYDTASTREANGPLPFSFSFTNTGVCGRDANCQLVWSEFGFTKPTDALDKKLVMLLDGANGPDPTLPAVLRSNSVPFLSTIFRDWATERLLPWVHFVPVDPRYHALHSTVSYFVGLRFRGRVNGRPQVNEPRTDDARWIAEQGRKWAETALRPEDMEVYLFRLLLEWGRLVDDDRANLAFTLEAATATT